MSLNLQSILLSQDQNWRCCLTQENSADDVRATQVKNLLSQLRLISGVYYLVFKNVLYCMCKNKGGRKNVHNQIILGLPFTSKGRQKFGINLAELEAWSLLIPM